MMKAFFQLINFFIEEDTLPLILRLVENTTNALNKMKFTLMVFLGIQETFDKLWHKGFLYKMIKFALPA
jgi:hypothetical protein